MKNELWEKYAQLAIKKGVNIQPGQILQIRSPLAAAELVRYCQKAAYQAGAKKVIIRYSDELANKIDLKLASEEALCEFPIFKDEEQKYLIKESFAVLSISAETPGLLKDVDPMKMQRIMLSDATNYKPTQDYLMSNTGQWCIIAYPSVGWAKKVFPELDDEAAVEKLLANILACVRVNEQDDIIEVWDKHNAELASYNQILTAYNFDYLEFKNNLGTDLKLHLADNHRWEGGSQISKNGVTFNPNIPTEECFCMPYKTKVNGKVVASKPLNYQGKLIEDFWMEFKDGKVVAFDAKKEREALKSIIEFDEGSCYLGEVALISYDSPINNTKILFYNTLFDENASCHLALGSAFPKNIKDSTDLKEDELLPYGYNKSKAHVDFMFGTADLDVVGYTHDGQVISIFKDGNFVF